eukprot:TRINITY_DN4757_c0_g1_i5.p1 TRINITY_DN4757_c0_g1~~TRINITY_DN4757_c0_g1_i5.p1  ORF type:complete len:582 (-),score=97.67 TRINITY_DN4757_c0_g1_i5:607-2316(-)
MESPEQVGLAAVTAAVQRSGGTREHPGAELDEQLEAMAARIEAGGSTSQMSVGFRCLGEDLSEVFSLFADVVQKPAMPQEKLSLVQSQLVGILARRNDDPGSVAAREMGKLLYGSESPYARVPTTETVRGMTRDDLIAFHTANFRPEEAVLGIWGDFDVRSAKNLIQQKFGTWAPPAISPGLSSPPASLPISPVNLSQSGPLSSLISPTPIYRFSDANGFVPPSSPNSSSNSPSSPIFLPPFLSPSLRPAESTTHSLSNATRASPSLSSVSSPSNPLSSVPLEALTSPSLPCSSKSTPCVSSPHSTTTRFPSPPVQDPHFFLSTPRERLITVASSSSSTSALSSPLPLPSPSRRRIVEPGLGDAPPALYLVDRPGLTQGYVRMGELGTTLEDPDVFALDVLNALLNGFGGRLFDEVRSREGLAYSVYGSWSPAVEHRGVFVAGGETRVSSVPQFVRAIRQVLAGATLEAPNEDELAQAKDASLNSFVFNFADSGSQLSRIMTYELFGIDQDFIFKYKRQVEATSAADVLRVAQAHLHPDQQTILIVTDVSPIRRELSRLGLPLVDLTLE